MQLKPELIRAAKRELKIRAARRALAPFVTYTTPGYMLGWVHAEICQALDKFLADVVAKKSPRLIICMPPRSGTRSGGTRTCRSLLPAIPPICLSASAETFSESSTAPNTRMSSPALKSRGRVLKPTLPTCALLSYSRS